MFQCGSCRWRRCSETPVYHSRAHEHLERAAEPPGTCTCTCLIKALSSSLACTCTRWPLVKRSHAKEGNCGCSGTVPDRQRSLCPQAHCRSALGRGARQQLMVECRSCIPPERAFPCTVLRLESQTAAAVRALSRMSSTSLPSGMMHECRSLAGVHSSGPTGSTSHQQVSNAHRHRRRLRKYPKGQ